MVHSPHRFGNRVSKLPDCDGLAVFAKVVQTRSFTGAAAELRLSKAAVSKAVSTIERKFETRLFNRTARRLAITEAGRELYDRAAHILAEGEAAETEVVAHSAVPRDHRDAHVIAGFPMEGLT
jgi:DNA-binding transcriptional LysR family regulator